MQHTLVDMLWVIVAAGLVFLMQAGFAMVEAGMTRSKNSINVAVKNLTDFGVSSVAFWLVGFGLMFGGSWLGLIGTDEFFFSATTAWPMVFFLFQTMFCSTSATIVSGAVAERMRFSSYIITTLVLSLIIYPVFGHWAWGGAEEGSPSGWLVKNGFVDFAGSTVVHSIGGWVALAVLLIIGPRTGRYKADGTPQTINGSNIPSAVLGVCLLWFGWFGFNGGSTLAMNNDVAGIIMRTSLAGATGLLGALAIGWPIYKRPEVGLVLNGALAGLVAITANCHAVTEIGAALIGLGGGAVMILGTWVLDKLKIDDAVGAIPVHLFAGVWGTLAVALFGDPAKLNTGLDFWHQLGIQALGIVAAGGWAFGIAWLTTFTLNKISHIRVSTQAEMDGLNKAEHGVTTEVHDLFSVLDTQAKTGNMALRAPVEPFTEVGQMATMYNSVMDRLQENTVAKGEFVQILQNVGDGLFLLDREGRVGPFYSAVLDQLFNSKDLAGKNLVSILEGFLPGAAATTIQEFLDVAFDGSIPWRQVEKLNPLVDVEAFFDDHAGGFANRNFQFLFQRVEEAGKVDRLLVLVRDTTNEKALSKEVEATREHGRQELELLQKVLHVEPDTLREFLEGLHGDLEAINDQFRAGTGSIKERLTEVFRLTHAIKGDAELLQLGFIGEKAETLEQRVEELRSSSNPSGEDLLPLTLMYSELATAAGRLDEVLTTLTGFRTNFDHQDGDYIGTSLTNMARRLAARYGKDVKVQAEALELGALNQANRKRIKDVLVQLVRNSVVHGIETPDQRLAAKKDRAGTIKITTALAGSTLHLVFSDDGAGINVEKIRAQALAKGLLSAATAQSKTDRDLIPLLFQPGFSTADTVDDVAGKGIGMSLVRKIVRDANGKISIRTQSGAFTEFRIDLELTQVAA